MAKQKKSVVAIPPPPANAQPWLTLHRAVWPAFVLATLIFYWAPLFEERATIQWDAVDVHYSAQKYFEQSLRASGLPHWTPFVFSGMPFLSDPQTAAWYPLHWPFFLIGVTPRVIAWEMALHSFLALAGTFLLARRLLDHAGAAALAAVFYAWSGFFAGHSSHLGMFETAALFPWLLWAGLNALESGSLRSILSIGCIGGLVVLAGHFQTALYSLVALALVLAVRRGFWKRAAVILVATACLAFVLGAVQVLPGLELASQSARATADYRSSTNAPLKPAALATLFAPNFYGVISGNYQGPSDITQFYFYQGLLLVPLAGAAFARRKAIGVPLVLIVPALWYALGPGAGLYTAITLLPGFRNVRAPVHIWFVVSLGLALAAAGGCAWLAERYRRSWLMTAVVVLSAADLWYWNMAANPLAYGRTTYTERYGNAYENYQNHLAGIKQQPFYRIWAPYATNAFGPLNSSLESRTEVTYGYNPLELARYGEYISAAHENPRLLDGLGVTHKIDTARGAIVENPGALPRVSAPANVIFVSGAATARAMLGTLDPTQFAIAEGPPRTLSPATALRITNYEDSLYRIRYSAAADCLLRIAVPYYPGWTAAVDGKPTGVMPVDYALSGVIVPAGDHELTFRYHPRWFRWGAVVSSLAALLCAGFLLSGYFPIMSSGRTH